MKHVSIAGSVTGISLRPSPSTVSNLKMTCINAYVLGSRPLTNKKKTRLFSYQEHYSLTAGCLGGSRNLQESATCDIYSQQGGFQHSKHQIYGRT
mgnify:CR=1 FL=1